MSATGSRTEAPDGRTLNGLFAPKSIVVIGASDKPGSVGQALWQNLRTAHGCVFPVNSRHHSIDGCEAFPSVEALPQPVELAVIATPARTVPSVLRQCGRSGVGAAIVISAGFREAGSAGLALEAEALEEARRGGIRFLGPNCLGLMIPHLRLNATFSKGMAKPGGIAFLSQSGALCTAVLDWSDGQNVGFSAFVSVGSMADIGWGELLFHFGADPSTKLILCYMESIGDAGSFLAAARTVSCHKPIVVLKVGRTAPAAKAAASHTGALTGTDAVLDAAFARAGVLRLNTLSELFAMAEIASKQPLPSGPNLTIVTNAGGPGVLATDALIAGGARLTSLSAPVLDSLERHLPPHWSHANPVDILGDATALRYTSALEATLQAQETDGVLVILTPQAMTEPTQTAQTVCNLAKDASKPLLTSWMGGPGVLAAKNRLNAARIPSFDFPDDAARAFAHLWKCRENLGVPLENSDWENLPEGPAPDIASVHGRLSEAHATGRRLLNSVEAAEILSEYGFPMVETRVAVSEDAAVECAVQIGFPVAVKLFSQTLTHKSEVGGVKLHLPSPASVREAWANILASVSSKAGRDHFQGVLIQPMIEREGIELILGCSSDPPFGPVLLFGSGGAMVEVYRDTALGLPPLNRALARKLMEGTKVFAALKGIRGCAPVDLHAIETLLMRLSRLVLEQPWIAEIDINPVLASPGRIIALDGRISLHPPECLLENIPRAALVSSSSWKPSPF